MKYLERYLICNESILVLALDGEKLVGASTGIPLINENPEIQKSFKENDFNLNDIFYFGESILLPEYRNKGLYKHFMQNREQATIKANCKITCFCAIERLDNDPRKPKDYLPLDIIWQKYGFTKQPSLCAYFKYKEVGEDAESNKKMIFWIKHL